MKKLSDGYVCTCNDGCDLMFTSIPCSECPFHFAVEKLPHDALDELRNTGNTGKVMTAFESRFPERLKKVRQQKGLTQAFVASIFSVPLSTYACYESGEDEPNLSLLLRFANYYEVSLDWLVGRY